MNYLFILGPSDGNWFEVDDTTHTVYLQEHTSIMSPIVPLDGVFNDYTPHTPHKIYIYTRMYIGPYSFFAPAGTNITSIVEALINSYKNTT